MYMYKCVTVQLLADEFGSSRSFVQLIRTDSGDIVDVIRQAYEVMNNNLFVSV